MRLFITATNTDVGKTYATQKLIEYYTKKGFKVGYFKPCETGVKDKPLDGSKILKLVKKLNPKFKNITIDDVVPYQFELPASPYVAKKNKKISVKKIKKQAKYLEQFCDILIIEGAGGLMVPLKKDFFIVDLIKELKAKTILITPSKLGSINDTLLSIEALKNRNLDFKWYINLYQDKDSFEEVSKPFLEKYFKKLNFLNEF